MNKQLIDQLLERYFEGDTSVAEERQLKAYFQNSEVAPEHRQYAPMFVFFARESQKTAPEKAVTKPKVIHFPAGYWKKMLAAACLTGVVAAGVWWYAPGPTGTESKGLAVHTTIPENSKTLNDTPSVEQVPQSEPSKNTGKKHKRANTKQVAMAGVSNSPVSKEEAEKAAAEVKAILEFVSGKLNKGAKKGTKDLQKVEIIEDIFPKKDS